MYRNPRCFALTKRTGLVVYGNPVAYRQRRVDPPIQFIAGGQQNDAVLGL
jgi:hypothetical protein